MNEKMIANWNDRVRPDDTIYHLGDFSFMQASKTKQLVQRLMGHKVLVLGNHDKPKRIKDAGFMEVVPYKEIKVGDQFIVLMHYAMKVWNKSHYGSWQLFGHSHGTMKRDFTRLQFDVGVDAWEFAPVSYDEVAFEMAKHTSEPVDYHEQLKSRKEREGIE